MVSLSTTIARQRAFYPRPIVSMPDILMIDLPAEFRRRDRYHAVLIETIAEQQELEACLEDEHPVASLWDLLNPRPSGVTTDHITVAHYGPPAGDWPYALLCRWPSDLAAATPKEMRMFVREAYTIELFANEEQLDRASDTLLAILRRRRRRARVEIILPDWSASPGKARH